MAFFSLLLLNRFGLGLAFFANFILVAALIVVAFIDLDLKIIPNVISLPGIVLGLLLSILQRPWPMDHLSVPPSPVSSILGIVLGSGFLTIVALVYYAFTRVEGMGVGDIKLLAMIGAFLGWPSIPVTLFIASLSGSAVGLTFMLARGVGSKYALPFAPFLCLGALFYLFFGNLLIAIYPLLG